MQEEQRQSVLYQEIRNLAIVMLPAILWGMVLFFTTRERLASYNGSFIVPIVFAFNVLWFVSTKIWPVKNKRTWTILTAIILTLSIYILVCSYYLGEIFIPLIPDGTLRISIEDGYHLWGLIITILLFNFLWLKAMKLWPFFKNRKIKIFLIILFFALSLWVIFALVFTYILGNAMH